MAKKILVVEDNEDLVTYLKVLFENNGYEVITAMNGEEAFTLLEKHKPDLVTLDLIMPERTGYNFYLKARKSDEFKDTPIFIITGFREPDYPMIEPKKFLYDRKVKEPDAFFEKPINEDELLKKIKDTLG